MTQPFLLVCLPYAAIAVGLTIWLARALSRHGEVFLDTVFDNPKVVHAVNQLLVIGFYLVNLGWAFLLAKGGGAVQTSADAIGLLVDKLGLLLLLLGVAHLCNLYVFHRIKKGNAHA
ncbi:MAG: hypothetical protein JO257_28350 [Deltaproteobacteria bacterium]|nr:hypothetical protein [Deltaproteobacteria bacterium]